MKREKKKRAWIRYRVEDMETGEMLAFGERHKDLSEMKPLQTFYSGLLRVTQYERLLVICDRLCKIVYWERHVFMPFRHNFNAVTGTGKRYGLRGSQVYEMRHRQMSEDVSIPYRLYIATFCGTTLSGLIWGILIGLLI